MNVGIDTDVDLISLTIFCKVCICNKPIEALPLTYDMLLFVVMLLNCRLYVNYTYLPLFEKQFPSFSGFGIGSTLPTLSSLSDNYCPIFIYS